MKWVIPAVMSMAVFAGEWSPGDRIQYIKGCHSAGVMLAVVEAWERGEYAPSAMVLEDCFQGSRPIPAMLLERVDGVWTMPDGAKIEVWRVLDALGDTEHTYIPAGHGPRDGV